MIVVEGVQLVVGGYIVGFGTVSGIVGGMYRHLVAISVCLMTGFKRASRKSSRDGDRLSQRRWCRRGIVSDTRDSSLSGFLGGGNVEKEKGKIAAGI